MGRLGFRASLHPRHHPFLNTHAQVEFSCEFSLIRPHCLGCHFPSPHLKGAGIGNSGTSPRPRFEGCTRQPSGKGIFGKTIQEGVPGLQRGPKAKQPRPTYLIIRDDCHLPAMVRLCYRLTSSHARRPSCLHILSAISYPYHIISISYPIHIISALPSTALKSPTRACP